MAWCGPNSIHLNLMRNKILMSCILMTFPTNLIYSIDFINEETIWLITLWIYNLLWIDSLFVLLNLGVGQKVSFNVNYVFPIIPFIVPRTINWLYMIWLFYVFLWNFWDFCLFSWYWNEAHIMIANFIDIQCPYFENMSLTANRLRVSYVGKISFF